MALLLLGAAACSRRRRRDGPYAMRRQTPAPTARAMLAPSRPPLYHGDRGITDGPGNMQRLRNEPQGERAGKSPALVCHEPRPDPHGAARCSWAGAGGLANAARLAAVLADGGLSVVTGGTDTHIILLDLSAAGLTGQTAERLLEQAGITSNKNPIPFDVRNPAKWSGLLLGVAAATGHRRALDADAGELRSRTRVGTRGPPRLNSPTSATLDNPRAIPPDPFERLYAQTT